MSDDTVEPGCEVALVVDEPESILLPGLNDMDDRKAYKMVRSFYKDSCVDINGQSDKAASLDVLAGYIETQRGLFRRHLTEHEHYCRQESGATMGKYWEIAKYLHDNLTAGAYGTNTVAQLAQKINCNPSYVYQLRHIGANLTLAQCVALGMRKCTVTTVKNLAALQDKETRDILIDTFLAEYPRTGDPAMERRALHNLNKAIAGKYTEKFEQLATSDPSTGATGITVSPEYDAFMTSCRTLVNQLSKICGNDKKEEAMLKPISNVMLYDNIPEANLHMQEVKEMAGKAKEMVNTAITLLKDINDELDTVFDLSVCASGD